MKIKKMYQGTAPENKILNTQSDSQTNVYSCNYINNLNTIIFEGNLMGGESTTLSNVKRFLDIYVRINFDVMDGTFKYTIDTTMDEPTCSGGCLTPFDEVTMNSLYMSECKFYKSTGLLEHHRIGFYVFASHTWEDRNAREGYTVYRVDTYD